MEIQQEQHNNTYFTGEEQCKKYIAKYVGVAPLGDPHFVEIIKKGGTMGLRIIYGRAGTGKTSFVCNEIKNNISLDNKIYIITPEQFSYSAEKELLNSLEQNSVINAEVISFNRIAHRVSLEVGGANKIHITKAR